MAAFSHGDAVAHRLIEAQERLSQYGRYNQVYDEPPLRAGAVGWAGLHPGNKGRVEPLPMTAVWSLWTKPLDRRYVADTLKMLALSIAVAKQQFQRTVFITDPLGASWAIELLRLGFDEVLCIYDQELAGISPDWWGAGKLLAYKIMADRRANFIHIDNDLFWWSVPDSILSKPLVAQNHEYTGPDCEVYNLSRFSSFADRHGIALPVEWTWAQKAFGPHLRAVNCGIFGGTNYAFISDYADDVLKLITTTAFRHFYVGNERNGVGDACITEQWFLDAKANYHGLEVFTLFESLEAAHECSVTELTHLLGPRKRASHNMNAVDEILSTDYPELWDRLSSSNFEVR